MFSRKRIAATLRYLYFGSIVFLSTNATLLAQYTKHKDEKEEPKGYASVYIIIIFCVGLALLSICRASTRTVDFRTDD